MQVLTLPVEARRGLALSLRSLWRSLTHHALQSPLLSAFGVGRQQRGPPHSCSVGRADVLTCAVKPGWLRDSRRHAAHVALEQAVACDGEVLRGEAPCGGARHGTYASLIRVTLSCVHA